MVYFMVLGRVNGTAWGAKLLLAAVWELYQFMSLTEDTALHAL